MLALLASLLVVLRASVLSAGVVLAGSSDPQAVAVLEKARAAFRAVPQIQYSFRLSNSGTAAAQTAAIDGMVRLLPTDERGGPYHFMAGTLTSSDQEQPPLEFTVGRIGSLYQVANREERVLMLASGEEVGSQMISFTDPILIENFIITSPLGVAGEGETVSLAGTATVAGELCDILVIPGKQGVIARWFFARSDSLPRAVERDVRTSAGAGVVRLDIHSLITTGELQPEDFKLRAPAGWRTVDVNALNVSPFATPAPRRMPDGLLMRGEQAPDFKLSTPGGEQVSLNDLRGEVVVLDFWATWCPPCRKAMPHVQALHEAYSGQDVRVIGVSTSERGGDPARMMAKKGFEYGLLLKGERVAPIYGVTALPTFYVIDKAGVVVHASRGFSSHEEKSIRATIDAALAR